MVPLAVDFSAVLVDLEPEAVGLSSSEKFFFNHLDGKHMAGIELGEEEGDGRRERSESRECVRISFDPLPDSFYIQGLLGVRENG